MAGYVKRINDATLRVPIGGIRIGQAKYSRLAQINLKTRIITFSRYAIEDVPERGRRYLVIHELAHVKEASHNKNFWRIVAEHEPRYKEISKELEIAFHKNVRARQSSAKKGGRIYQARLFPSTRVDDWLEVQDSLELGPQPGKANISETGQLRLLLENSRAVNDQDKIEISSGHRYPSDSGSDKSKQSDFFSCDDAEFGAWPATEDGIIYGGSDAYEDLDENYFDHI